MQNIVGSSDLFCGGKGSDTGKNMTGNSNASYLTETFASGFDYVGNSDADIPVWKVAQCAYAYNASEKTIKNAQRAGVKLTVLSKK